MLLGGACAPLSLFWPRSLSPDETLTVRAVATPGPRRPVEILLDDRGVPHVYGADEEDLSFGLGFLHARDRLFQLLLLRHRATGRLGEIFGRGLVDEDRRLRLLTSGLEAEERALDPRALALAEAYIRGVHEGRAHAGRSLEMQALGLGFLPFTVRDVLAIQRLFEWELAGDLKAELARARIDARLPKTDPRRLALLAPTPSGGVPVLPSFDDSPREPLPALPYEPLPERAPPRTPAGRSSLLELLEAAGAFPAAASSSLAVSGSRTRSERPILVADPHLAHRAPGALYLVHLEAPDLQVAGASLPGLPGVQMGFTPHLAFALGASHADTQDLVRIAVSPQRADRYLVDGEELPFERRLERFSAGREVLVSETWRETVFGPLLPAGYGSSTEPGELYAVLWPGFMAHSAPAHLVAPWELARARTIDEASAALELARHSGAVTLAFAAGPIAFRLAGRLPQRASGASGLPRDGRTRAAAWAGFVSSEDKPRADDPAKGFLVVANQRLTDDDHPAARLVGHAADTPHRAERLHERLTALLAEERPTLTAVLALQQDVLSTEARRLQPILAAACPAQLRGRSAKRVEAFCAAVRGFDGRYRNESLGALPFTLLLAALYEEVLAAHLGADVARQVLSQPFAQMALERALLEEAAGQPSPLLDDLRTAPREGLQGFVALAAARALDLLQESYGEDPAAWRWGRVHTLSFESGLAAAPLLGGAFKSPRREQAGWTKTPRAEAGLPVSHGAALRLGVELTDPVDGRMIGDFGNSGHVGHPHFGDWLREWEAGVPFAVPMARDDVERAARGRLLLLPSSLAEPQ
jgi:penicillin G amidase